MTRGLVLDQELQSELGVAAVSQTVHDGIPTFWVSKSDIHEAICTLRSGIPDPYNMLFDLTCHRRTSALASRRPTAERLHRRLPPLSYERNAYVRIKVALDESQLRSPR